MHGQDSWKQTEDMIENIPYWLKIVDEISQISYFLKADAIATILNQNLQEIDKTLCNFLALNDI